MKIYIVGGAVVIRDGRWYQWHTPAAFSTRELAEGEKLHRGGEPDILEVELDAPSVAPSSGRMSED